MFKYQVRYLIIVESNKVMNRERVELFETLQQAREYINNNKNKTFEILGSGGKVGRLDFFTILDINNNIVE